MTIEAELFDGTVLEFPDGTDPQVIQKVVKTQTAQRRTAAPAAPGAPAFAVVYPGGIDRGPVTVARGPDGPGGILSFTTEATPDAVVAFYRQRAEAAGLASVMAMNTGEARAYGAAAGDGSGKLLHVVATPVEGGPTSVQLDWTNGR